jgi:hypothetical protein
MKLLEGQDQQVAGAYMSCYAHSDIACCSDVDVLRLAGHGSKGMCLL